MGAQDVELIGLYWTLSGPVEVHTGREWSLFDLPDRCAQAARVGFKGIGIWHADLEHLLEQRSLREIRQILDDHGIGPIELEFLMDWFLDEDHEDRKEADRIRKMIFEAAEVLPVHHLKVGNIPARECPLSKLTEKYAELCADAARHTDVKVAYEIIPSDPIVHTLEAAVQLVDGARAPNGGIAIDTWHMGKLHIAPDDLRVIPPEYLAWVELSDGLIKNMPDFVDEVINHRELPGEGEFDIPGYIRVLSDMGYAEPWGVEVLSEKLRNLPMEQIFDRAYETTRAQF